MKPLPVKTRTSFNIPLLIQIIEKEGVYHTDARFEDLLVIRSYLQRHNSPYKLSQKRVEGGFELRLRKESADA